MSEHPLKYILQRWSVEKLTGLPPDDPRKTSACLSFGDIEAVAEGSLNQSMEQREHIQHCIWCQRGLAQMARLIGDKTQLVETSLHARNWPAALSEMLTAWLKQTAAEELALGDVSSAHFDSEGILRIHCSGLSVSGM